MLAQRSEFIIPQETDKPHMLFQESSLKHIDYYNLMMPTGGSYFLMA